ncbi:MAG: response regulator [Deltaproteobacteria bacterium]|nr:response regulator [Deltaproteobacteria bacterium]
MSSAPPRVLVADDARVMRMLLRTWLERLGCVVIEAASGTEALAVVAREPLDAALLDIHMPGLTGLQVLESVRGDQRSRGLPIVIITTLGHASDVERGLKLGATAYLTKPLGYSELYRALLMVLPELARRNR